MPKKADIVPEEQAGTEYRTEDLDKTRYTAGKITEEGIVIIPEEMSTKDGSNGPFRVVAGMDQKGKACDLVFSSAKLTKIFDTHWEELKGKKVLVTGHGVAFERQYAVKLV